jgi:hypothetical protein
MGHDEPGLEPGARIAVKLRSNNNSKGLPSLFFRGRIAKEHRRLCDAGFSLPFAGGREETKDAAKVSATNGGVFIVLA